MPLSPLRPSPPEPAPASASPWRAPFVGRSAELAALGELLDRPDCRWITVTGPSGIGKTRLLEAVDLRLATAPAHVIWAAPLTGPVGRGLDRVAHALGMTGPVRSLDTAIAQIIGPAPTLLILDDAVPEGARGVSSLLELCPRLTVLAVSMDGLGLPEETRFEVGGLDPESASMLFIERASRVSPELGLTERARRDIARICARLQGNPLDLEITAARVGSLGIAGVASELTGAPAEESAEEWAGESAGERAGAPALPRGVAGSLDRHAPGAPGRPIGSALMMSYRGLGPDAQRLLRAVSVFRGAFDLEQAQAVSPGDDERLIDALSELVDAWLVEPDAPAAGHLDPDGNGVRDAALDKDAETSQDVRFRLAPVIREVARALADAAGERTALQTRHAQYHSRKARSWAGSVDDAREHDELRDVVAILPELFAVSDWYASQGELASALRVAADLAPVALSQGNARAVSQLLSGLLTDPAAAAVDAHTRGDALVWLARAHLSAVDSEDTVELAMRHWAQGLALLRQTGDDRAVLRALAIGAQGLPVTRDLELTRALLAEGVELAEHLDHAAWRARFEVWSGMLAHQLRDLEQAWRLGVSSLSRARRSGDRHGEIAACLLLIPLVGDFPEPPGGVPTPRELLDLCRAVHDAALASLAVAFLAEEALDAGDARTAARWIATRLSGMEEFEAWHSSGYSLMLTARAAMLLGERALAATLHGALLGMLPTLLAGCPPRYADHYTAAVAGLRESLGPEEFDRYVHEGSLIPWTDALEMAVANAIRFAGSPRAGRATDPERARATEPVLSAREHQILHLIGTGLTGRGIAHRLDLPARTVLQDAAQVYRKLGVRGRAEVVARLAHDPD